MGKTTTSDLVLAPELEQAVLALWPSQPPEARALWLKVLNTLLPPQAELLEALADLEADHTEEEEAVPADSRLAALAMTGPPVRAFKDWRETVGMFADDPIIDAITEAGARIRAAERTPE